MIRFFTSEISGNVLADFEIEIDAPAWRHVVRGKIVVGNHTKEILVIWPHGSPRYPHYARDRNHDFVAKKWILEEWYKWQA